MIGLGWLRSRLTEQRASNNFTDLAINQLNAAATGIGSVRQSAVYASCLTHARERCEFGGTDGRALRPPFKRKWAGSSRRWFTRGQSAYELVIGSSGRLESTSCPDHRRLRLGCARNLELQDRAAWTAFNRDDHSTTRERAEFSAAAFPKNPMERLASNSGGQHDCHLDGQDGGNSSPPKHP